MKRLLVQVVLFLALACPSYADIPASLGWYQIPNTTLNAVAPSAVTYPNIQGNEGVRAVMDDWSGGAADKVNNRLYIWGGGHAGYAGNEVYYLDLNTLTMVRNNNPSNPINTGDCSGNNTYPDGRPVARHTYSNVEFIPYLDLFFAWGGSLWQCGGMGNDTWTYAPTTDTWTSRSSTNGPSANHSRAMAFDASTGLIYARDDFNLRSFNPRTMTWTNRSTSQGISTDNYKVAVIDTTRKRYYYTDPSSGALWYYDISSATSTNLSRVSATLSGCTFDGQGGLEYDSYQDRIIQWAGGNSVFSYNPATGTCSTVTFSGGPGAQNGNGTYGRFRYFPKLNLFVVCNTTNANCYSLRMTAALNAADQDFVNRCYAAGVIKCVGFDNSGDFSTSNIYQTGNGGGTGIQAGGNSTPTLDASTVASGAGSVRFTIVSGSGASGAGFYAAYFNESFVGGSTFYVQFRQRFDSNMVTVGSGFGGGGWKQVILHNRAATCAGLEITTNNGYYRGIPQMYTDCGQGLIEWGDGVNVILQYSSVYPPGSSAGTIYCKYNFPYTTGNKCFPYVANEWWTFKYKITIGTFGTASSRIEAWVMRPGDTSFTQFINRNNYTLNQDSPGLGFDYVTLLPYDTGKDGRAHAQAQTWYDELIVSKQDIAAPGQSGSSPAPAAPFGLTGTGRTSGGVRF